MNANTKASNLGENSGIYAGIMLGKYLEPDYHLILLHGCAESVNLQEAIDWAQMAGGDLPTRREQFQLLANIKEHLKLGSYWSNDQQSINGAWCTDGAWCTNFDNGQQTRLGSDCKLSACAIRRIIINA